MDTRKLAPVAAILAPLAYGLVGFAAISAHASRFDARSVEDRAELRAALASKGMTPEQVQAVAIYEGQSARAVSSLVVGVGFASVGTAMFVGITLASLALRRDRAAGPPSR